MNTFAAGPKARVETSFRRGFKFSVDDYIRSQDAKSGLIDLYIPCNAASRPQSRVSSRLSTRGRTGDSQPNSRPGTGISGFVRRDTPPQTTEKPNEVKAKLRAQRKIEEQNKLVAEINIKKGNATVILQARFKSALVKPCRTPGLTFDSAMILFFHRNLFEKLAACCKSKLRRVRYEENPYVSPAILSFFPGISRSRSQPQTSRAPSPQNDSPASAPPALSQRMTINA